MFRRYDDEWLRSQIQEELGNPLSYVHFQMPLLKIIAFFLKNRILQDASVINVHRGPKLEKKIKSMFSQLAGHS